MSDLGYTFPAAIEVRASEADLTALAKKRAPEPSIFDTYEPFFWRARISTNRLDAYFTAMKPSSLKNYAADAETGVAFQDSHKTDGLSRTLGHSLTGKFVGAGGNGIASTESDFYTLRGFDPTIDNFVTKLLGGLSRDVSIGFYGGQFICSICGRDMLTDFACWHYPGFTYTPTDEEGRKQKDAEKVLCTADVEDAHLAEVSAVYDGATPGAVILKAQRAASDGRLRPETARLLENRYRILDLSRVQHIHPVAAVEPDAPQEQRMPPEEQDTQPEPPRAQADVALIGRIRAALARHGIETEEAGVAEQVERLLADNQRLAPLAKDGQTYRDEIVETAIKAGVRAFSVTNPAWDVEQHRILLKSLPLETARAMSAAWQAIGDQAFSGGRQTADEDERDAGSSGPVLKEPETPNAAYAG